MNQLYLHNNQPFLNRQSINTNTQINMQIRGNIAQLKVTQS